MSKSVLRLVADIVSGQAQRSPMKPDELMGCIRLVHETLVDLPAEGAIEETGATPPMLRPTSSPAVPINKSVFPEYIVCLEDGKKLTMLKRHLSTAYSMTKEEYRIRWGLPDNYPMVAPSYAKRRSEIAKETGLGVGGRRGKSSAQYVKWAARGGKMRAAR